MISDFYPAALRQEDYAASVEFAEQTFLFSTYSPLLPDAYPHSLPDCFYQNTVSVYNGIKKPSLSPMQKKCELK